MAVHWHYYCSNRRHPGGQWRAASEAYIAVVPAAAGVSGQGLVKVDVGRRSGFGSLGLTPTQNPFFLGLDYGETIWK